MRGRVGSLGLSLRSCAVSEISVGCSLGSLGFALPYAAHGSTTEDRRVEASPVRAGLAFLAGGTRSHRSKMVLAKAAGSAINTGRTRVLSVERPVSAVGVSKSSPKGGLVDVHNYSNA